MEFVTDNILLIGLALGSGLMLLWPLLNRGAGGLQASPSEAVLLINRGNALVLDVRDQGEFAAGHIADAKHIPAAELESRIGELRKFKDKPIIVQCQSGMRSAQACATLRRHEFSQVHNLQGGLNAWTQAKLPLVRG